MKKINITSLLEKGSINLFELKEKGSDLYLLTVNETAVPHEIILKKETGAGYIAYIPTSIPMSKYTILAKIVTELFESGVYSGMFSYVPMRADTVLSAEEKKIIGIVKPKVGNKMSEIDQMVEDLGYSFLEEDVESRLKNRRDYSLIMESNPALKERFLEDDVEIKALGASFEDLSFDFKNLYKVIENGDCLGALITGPTGVGKSYAINLLANKLGAPKLVVGITYGTSIDDLIGSYAPNDVELSAVQAEMHSLWKDLTNKSLKDDEFAKEVNNVSQKIYDLVQANGGTAKWIFKEGPLLMAYKYGYLLQLDEINFGQPGVLAQLNTCTDFNNHMMINGEIVKRHKNFVVMMTFNPGYKGTEELNTALKNRFPIIDFPKLTKAEYTKRMIGYSRMKGHAFSEKFFNEVFDYATFIEKTSDGFHEDAKFSVRNAQRLTDMVLADRMSFEEFASAVHMQFTNILNCDNDNSQKLQDFKADTTTVAAVKKIYDLYDYSEPTTVKFSEIDLNDFLGSAGSSSGGDESKSEDGSKAFDDLLKGMGL